MKYGAQLSLQASLLACIISLTEQNYNKVKIVLKSERLFLLINAESDIILSKKIFRRRRVFNEYLIALMNNERRKKAKYFLVGV